MEPTQKPVLFCFASSRVLVRTQARVTAVRCFKINKEIQVANCDFKFPHSLRVSLNIKSSGNRSIFLFTCSLSLLVSTPYISAITLSIITSESLIRIFFFFSHLLTSKIHPLIVLFLFRNFKGNFAKSSCPKIVQQNL